MIHPSRLFSRRLACEAEGVTGHDNELELSFDRNEISRRAELTKWIQGSIQ